jgi:hypothetical protein
MVSDGSGDNGSGDNGSGDNGSGGRHGIQFHVI